MSLGEGAFSTFCDAEPYKPAIDNLRAIGIASVVASGNSYSANSMGSPACVSTAVSIGSTTKADAVVVVLERHTIPVAVRAGRIDHFVRTRRRLRSRQRHVDGRAARDRRLGADSAGGADRQRHHHPERAAELPDFPSTTIAFGRAAPSRYRA